MKQKLINRIGSSASLQNMGTNENESDSHNTSIVDISVTPNKYNSSQTHQMQEPSLPRTYEELKIHHSKSENNMTKNKNKFNPFESIKNTFAPLEIDRNPARDKMSDPYANFTPAMIPLHVIDPNIFILTPPGMIQNKNLLCIFSIWNSMVGSGLFILPYAFYTSGIVASIIAILVVAVCLMYTCLIVIGNCKYAADFNDIIYKYGGNKFRMLHILSAFVGMIFCSYIYAILVNQGIYAVIIMVVELMYPQITPNNLGFTEFQCSLIVFTIVGLLIFQKSTKLIVMLSSYGAYVVILVIVWLLYRFVFWSSTSTLNGANVNYVAPYNEYVPNYLFIVGPMLNGYVIHPMIMPILRNNECYDISQMKKNTIIAFVLVFFTYLGCGIFGFFAYYYDKTQDSATGVLPQNILMLVDTNFSNDILGNLVRFLSILQYITLIPLYVFVSRDLFFNGIMKSSQQENNNKNNSTTTNQTNQSNNQNQKSEKVIRKVNESRPLLQQNQESTADAPLLSRVRSALNSEYLYNSVYLLFGLVIVTYVNIGLIMNYLGLVVGFIITVATPIVVWICKYYMPKRFWNPIDIKIYYQQFKDNELYTDMLKRNNQEIEDTNLVLNTKLAFNVGLLIIITAFTMYCLYITIINT